MEGGWNFFTNSTNGTRGQNGHCSNVAWDVWELGSTSTSRFDWNGTSTTNNNNNSFHEEEEEEEHAPPSTTPIDAAAAAFPDASAAHALMLSHHHHHHHHGIQTASLYAGAGTHYQPDPHLMCLNLGKRHYFEDTNPLVLGDRDVGGFSIAKRGRPHYGGFGGGFGGGVGGGGMELPPTNSVVTVASTATVPRCQVEGCHVALVNVKEYHRRHKVCEMHSKAPKVVVLGLEQRFCQQCSRFHAVSEFDDSKRSCRRRLAGHNERRRKGSQESSVSRNPSQGGRVLSLLSSRNNSWFSSPDLSSRCSAALRELIAENRAAVLARQFVPDGDWLRHHHGLDGASAATQPSSNSPVTSHHQTFPEPHSWERFSDGGGHLTLDLMQAPSTEFGFLSVRGKSKEEEEEAACSELWSSLGGAHLV